MCQNVHIEKQQNFWNDCEQLFVHKGLAQEPNIGNLVELSVTRSLSDLYPGTLTTKP